MTAIAGSDEEGDADGVGDAAQFCELRGVTISPDGSTLFVADSCNEKIRRVAPHAAAHLSTQKDLEIDWLAPPR